MLSVANEPIMLRVIMLSVITLSIIMLNVVAPIYWCKKFYNASPPKLFDFYWLLMQNVLIYTFLSNKKIFGEKAEQL